MGQMTIDMQFKTTAAKIAEEALADAKTCVGREAPGFGGPIHIFACSITGRWQIHSTSKLLTIDASVPLTAETTATEAGFAAALEASFAKKFAA